MAIANRSVVLLSVILLAACGGVKASLPLQPIAANSAIELDLQLPLIDGGQWSATEKRGKVVVIDVWASYCKPCKKGLLELARLAQAEPNAEFATISVDEADSVVRAFQQEVAFGLLVARDPEAKLLAKSAAAVTKLPTLVILDRKGRIRFWGEELKTEEYQRLGGLVRMLIAEPL